MIFTCKLLHIHGYALASPPKQTALITHRHGTPHVNITPQIKIIVFQQGLKLPGSRTDIIRKQNISGPSPVGGSSGGTEGKVVQTLDEFEYQAAHYNIACAFASLNQVDNSCKSLEQAFNYGFDNYATVRADPDLENVHGSPEFDNLMERFDSKKGFFGLFK